MTDAVEPGPASGPQHMTSEEFRAAGRAAVDWFADFLDDHRHGGQPDQSCPTWPPATLPVATGVATQGRRAFADLLGDVDRLIAPATTQWQHPGFYGFFPADSSPPAILGELLSAGLGYRG
ncbi:MAG: hypothetical protein Ct9H300mP12_16930 [Acidimicrobiales bacterium]|nr:MAG: hypothetical protein Ct9H300mP12_16930 [Acidimicrobiales bacterium]